MKKFYIFLFLTLYAIHLSSQYESAVYLYPGDNLQAEVDAHSYGTLYILKEGIHRMQKIIPKSDDLSRIKDRKYITLK